ncbi:MAG: hypothetical protein H0T69_02405 [Thermoleophilaceae bacterium]|nr:hypothetical protein [Thermoleophilaceae bacterium]
MTRIAIVAALLAAFATVGATNAYAAPAKLSYKQARKAAQTKGDAFAGQPTKISYLFRTGPRRYSASSKWRYTVTDPDGCTGCGYDPATGTFYDTPSTETFYCSADLVVLKRGRRVVAKVDGHSCF